MKLGKITIDGTEYALRPWTIGQLEDIAELSATLRPEKIGFATFYKAMQENAEPPVEEPRKLYATPNDMTGLLNEMNRISHIRVGAVDAEGEVEAGPT